MNLNLPSDIEKKIDSVFIALPYDKLSLQNLLKNVLPSEEDLDLLGTGTKFRIRPGDSGINFSQKESKSGVYWNFRFEFELVDNNRANFSTLDAYSNKKVVLVIGTSTHRYQVGWKDQALDFSFRETLEGFKVSVSGDVYFPAARRAVVSFRSSF